MLLFEVSGQSLKRTDRFDPATDSQEYLKAKFTFNSSDWGGKTKTAMFRLGEQTYKSLLDGSGVCKVPSEVLEHADSRYYRTHGSLIHVSLIGEYSTTRITTNEIAVKLKSSGYGDALVPSDPTESEYQQIVSAYADLQTETEAARADIATAKNSFANAIKGNLSGAVVFADDVSPVEHNPIVKVQGKNLLPFPYASGGGTSSGVTFSISDDGGVSVTGTPTAYTGIPLYSGAPLVTKGKVAFSVSGTFVNTNTAFVMLDSDGLIVYEKELYANGANAIVNTDDYPTAKSWLISVKRGTNGTAMSGTVYPQIEIGDTATDYEPYLDPSTVKVTRCGKNLIPYPFYQSTTEINGCKFTANSDGSISASGTATGVSYITIYSGNPLVKHGKFTISISGNYQNIIYHLIVLDSDGNELLVLQDYLTKTINADDYPTATKWMLNIKRHENKTVSGTVYPQIECGEKATAFEQYKTPTTHIPAADGTVSGLTSLSPNMTILTDTEGAIVECEYIQDTKRYVDGNGASPEQIENAVNNYLDENPVESGATAEQVAQIQANTKSIGDIETALDSIIAIQNSLIGGETA